MTKKAMIFIFLAFGFLLGCGGSNQDRGAGNRKGKSRLSFDVQKSDVEPMKYFGDTSVNQSCPPSSPEATSPAPQGRTEQGR
jgi:hypothetical protein